MSGIMPAGSVHFDVSSNVGGLQVNGASLEQFDNSNLSPFSGGGRKKKRTNKKRRITKRRSRRGKGKRTKACKCKICKCKNCRCNKKNKKMNSAPRRKTLDSFRASLKRFL